MSRPAVLLLLFVLVAVAGAAWALLGVSAEPVDAWEDEPIADSVPNGPGEPEGPIVPEQPAVVELPAEATVPRVAVLAADSPLLTLDGEEFAARQSLEEGLLPAAPGSLDAAELLRAVAEAVPVRFESEAVRKEVAGLGADPEWPQNDEALSILDLVEHWRRSGYEVELRGRYLVVRRHREEPPPLEHHPPDGE